MATVLTAAELASRIDAEVVGDTSVSLSGVGGIRDAEPGELSFLANMRYAGDAAATRASAVIVPKDWDKPCSATLLKVANPDAAFARAVGLFVNPLPDPSPAIHPTAVLGEGVTLGSKVYIGPHVTIEPGARIGDGCILHAGVYIGHQAVLGERCKLYPNVSLREQVQLGSRVIVHNGAVIGSDGFGYSVDAAGVRTKIPQVGTVVVGDDVEIGANVTIDRARFGKTRIGNGVKIDNLVQVAHNVVVGDHSVLVAQVGIAGSTKIGRRVILAGQVGVTGHVEIGDDVVVGAKSTVLKDVPAKSFVSGYPAMPHDKATRAHAHMMRIPQLKERIKMLEERLAQLEARLGEGTAST